MNTQLFQYQKIATLLQKAQQKPEKPEFKGYGFVFTPSPSQHQPIPKIQQGA